MEYRRQIKVLALKVAGVFSSRRGGLCSNFYYITLACVTTRANVEKMWLEKRRIFPSSRYHISHSIKKKWPFRSF